MGYVLPPPPRRMTKKGPYRPKPFQPEHCRMVRFLGRVWFWSMVILRGLLGPSDGAGPK